MRSRFGARWLVPRRLRHRHLPHQRQPDPVHRSAQRAAGQGQVDKNGNITAAGEANGVLKSTASRRATTSTCGYYQYLQGTSMASPHATGVAALAVAAHGTGRSAAASGCRPTQCVAVMATATDHACPAGGVQSYTEVGRSAEFTATASAPTTSTLLRRRHRQRPGSGAVKLTTTLTSARWSRRLQRRDPLPIGHPWLDKRGRHEWSVFDCGDPAVDGWLRLDADVAGAAGGCGRPGRH